MPGLLKQHSTTTSHFVDLEMHGCESLSPNTFYSRDIVWIAACDMRIYPSRPLRAFATGATLSWSTLSTKLQKAFPFLDEHRRCCIDTPFLVVTLLRKQMHSECSATKIFPSDNQLHNLGPPLRTADQTSSRISRLRLVDLRKADYLQRSSRRERNDRSTPQRACGLEGYCKTVEAHDTKFMHCRAQIARKARQCRSRVRAGPYTSESSHHVNLGEDREDVKVGVAQNSAQPRFDARLDLYQRRILN